MCTLDLRRIAYVEDEPDIRTITLMALNQLGGFEVDVSCDGNEALERIPAYGPDLVLMDVMMPGLTGPDVLRKLTGRPDFHGIPTIFMTAKAQTHEVAQYFDIGAAGVIPKPFDPMTLCDQIRQIWTESRKAA